MRVSLKSKPLKNAMAAVQEMFPEQQQALLTAVDGKFTAEAGGGGSYLKLTLAAEIMDDGEVLVDSNHLRSLDLNEFVELELEDTSLKFKSEKLKGKIATLTKVDAIYDARPLQTIETPVRINKDIVKRAVDGTNFPVALAQTQEGLRVKIDTHLTVTTTDQFKASLHKEALPFEMTSFDVVMKPTLLLSALNKIPEQEIWLGERRGTLHLESPTFSMYHPTIQAEPSDVEGWLDSLKESDPICTVEVPLKELLGTIKSVSSILSGSGFDTKFQCQVTDKEIRLLLADQHGSASSTVALTSSNASDTHDVSLVCKYTIDMLSLLKAADIKLHFWPDHVVAESPTGAVVLPTASD